MSFLREREKRKKREKMEKMEEKSEKSKNTKNSSKREKTKRKKTKMKSSEIEMRMKEKASRVIGSTKSRKIISGGGELYSSNASLHLSKTLKNNSLGSSYRDALTYKMNIVPSLLSNQDNYYKLPCIDYSQISSF